MLRMFRGDDIQGFDTRWDEVHLSMKETPQAYLFGSVYKRRVEHLQTILVLHDPDTSQKGQTTKLNTLEKYGQEVLETKDKNSEFRGKDRPNRKLGTSEARRRWRK